MAAPDSPWLTVAEASLYARCCAKTIHRACSEGKLRHARLAGRRAVRLRTEWDR
jgi:excisionase family DNA binding protein